MSTATGQRSKVLAIYRRILRTALNWTSKSGDPEQTATERVYILEEARTLFKKNKQVNLQFFIFFLSDEIWVWFQITNPVEIGEKIREAEARLEIGKNDF